MRSSVLSRIDEGDVNRATRAVGILLTAHDHLEGPWGDGRQAEALICDGYVGDGVLVPEYLADRLPGAGRGMAIFEVPLTRSGEPVHEVLRPEGLLDVLGAGAELVCRLRELDTEVGFKVNDVSGRDSLFVGQIDAGEIYNQATRDVPRAWHASLGDARRRGGRCRAAAKLGGAGGRRFRR